MHDLAQLISDPYNRKARLYPAMLVIAPVLALAVVIRPDLVQSKEILGFIPLGIVLSFLVTQVVRDASKKREPLLFNAWGGMPSITALRHRTSFIDPGSKARYHSLLASLVSGTAAITESQESADPKEADKTYAVWSEYLRNKTRDNSKFHLLFAENVNYGFRRNTWGVKVFGITSSVGGLIVGGYTLYIGSLESGDIDVIPLVSFFSILLLLGFWVLTVRKSWVLEAAQRYARQLIVSVDEL